MELGKVYSSFRLPNSVSQSYNNNTNPIYYDSKSNEQGAGLDKNKAYISIAAALGIGAMAVAAIKLGPKVFKEKAISNVLPVKSHDLAQTVTNDLSVKVSKNDDILENPLGFFRRRLADFFDESTLVDFDSSVQLETLRNGSKKYTYGFKDKDDVIHSVKFLTTKDDKFLSIFDDAVSDNGDIRRAKYLKSGFTPVFSLYKNADGSVAIKSFKIGNKNYYKEIKKYQDGTSEEVLKNGLLGDVISKAKVTRNANGQSVKFITDFSADTPVDYVRIIGAKNPKYAVMPLDQYGKVLVYELDFDGRVLAKSTQRVQDYMWDVSAQELDLAQVLNLEPAHSFGGNLEDLFRKNPNYKNATRGFIEENAILDYSSDIFGDFKGKYFDVPERFAVISNSIATKNGTALVCDSVPELFKDIDVGKIQKALDNFTVLRDSKAPVYEFEIAGKKFRAAFVGGGQIGNVYKIEDCYGNAAALKIFKDPFLLGPQSCYSEIPLLRQMNKEGVNNVPKFYMANPIGRPVYVDGNAAYSSHGGWMLSQYITKDTPKKQGDFEFKDWLKNHNLIFCDYNDGTKLGDYFVDIGGVASKENLQGACDQVMDTLDNRLLATLHNGATISSLLNV